MHVGTCFTVSLALNYWNIISDKKGEAFISRQGTSRYFTVFLQCKWVKSAVSKFFVRLHDFYHHNVIENGKKSSTYATDRAKSGAELEGAVLSGPDYTLERC